MDLQLKGNKNIIKGKLKEKYGELTDDDLMILDGEEDQIMGKLQQKLGKSKDELEKELNDWIGSKTL